MKTDSSLQNRIWNQSPRLDLGNAKLDGEKKHSDQVMKTDTIRSEEERITKQILIDLFRRQWIKKSRGYACKKRGHECWSWPLKNKKKTDYDDENSVWVRNIQEDDNKVQAYGEYIVQGTDVGNWDKNLVCI